MSCWVVPTVAAELWGVSVEHVIQCIRDGRLTCRSEAGFTFVDIAPETSTIKPPTYTVITPEEFAALTGHGPEDVAIDLVDADDEVNVEIVDAEADEASHNISDWRAAREQASRMRIAPRRMAG
jgi:hypothetical protein